MIEIWAKFHARSRRSEKSSAFAEASTFAKAMVDKTVDREVGAQGREWKSGQARRLPL